MADFDLVPVDHDPFSEHLGTIGKIGAALTPEWAKPFAGMSPEQANREAKILQGPQASGKIGPGYLSDTQRLGEAAEDIASLAAPETKGVTLGMASPAAMAAARKVVPWATRAEEGAGESLRLHPDTQRELIRSLYGDAAATKEEAYRAAWAQSTHQAEQESGFWLVKDPEARKAQGLPPIPPGAKSPWDVKKQSPAAPAANQSASTSPPPARGWLQSLMDRVPASEATSEIAPKAIKSMEDLRPAYNEIVKSQHGLGTVDIADLHEKSGLPLKDFHDLLMKAVKAGDVTIHPTTAVGLPRRITDAGITIPGFDEPFVSMKFKK